VRRAVVALGCSLAVASAATQAFAQTAQASQAGQAGQPAPTLAPDAKIDISTAPPEGKTSEPDATLPEPPAEVPPARARHKGVVLETTAGMLGFSGNFRHVAPPAPWLHTQLGYEIFRWLMVFGEAELGFTDTSEAQGESTATTFAMFGFGAGVRGTLHATERVAFFLQGDLGWLEAMVPHGTLQNLGYTNAEGLTLGFGTRLGVEWYMVDRHLALTAQGGLRDAQGFKQAQVGGLATNDTPLMWDAALGLRYTF
jgi:hypothetical protein